MYTDFKQRYSTHILDTRGRVNSNLSRSKIFPEILDQANLITQHLPESITFKERIFCIVHDIHMWGSCESCGSPTKLSGLVTEASYFRQFCSFKCSRKPGSSTFVNIKRTCNEKYGAACFLSSEESLKRRIANGGTGLANPKTQEKAKSTNLKKYGVENVFQSDVIKQKIADTHNERYGGNFNTVSLGNKLDKLKDAVYCKELAAQFCLNTIAEMLGVATNTIYKYFELHGIKNFNSSRSNQEVEVINFLKSLGIENIQPNDRKVLKPQEIDVFLPDYSIGIEMNGNYWHSEKAGCKRSYHFDKHNKAISANVKLIQIFESEWVLKQDLVKSRLKSILGKNEHKFAARKCSIKDLTIDEKRKFLNANHLQGDCKSSVNLGLFLNDNLVACMTFAKTRFDKSADFEMTRFCSKQNTTVVGGFQKLMTHFRKTKNFPSIISYADSRWSNGGVYSGNGFNLVSTSKPSYYYFKASSLILENRMNYQKGNLKKLLPEFDENLSEWKNMQNAGYNRIWDCGTTKWLIK